MVFQLQYGLHSRFRRIISILLDQGFQVPGAKEKVAFLLDKRLSPEEVADAMRKAEELRKDGTTVLVQKMAKNRKFQRDQLEQAGYTKVEDIYAER